MKIINKPLAPGFDHPKGQKNGFSLIELLIVLVIIGVMSAISLPYIYNSRNLYRSEEQALKIMDMMKEASQLALTKRRTFRFELNIVTNTANIIDETGALPRKTIPLFTTDEIRMNQPPTGVTRPNPPNYNDAVFTSGVWAARFRSNGTVVNAAGNPISATIYLWSPATDPATPLESVTQAKFLNEVRAVTIFGGTGAVRYWKFADNKFIPN